MGLEQRFAEEVEVTDLGDQMAGWGDKVRDVSQVVTSKIMFTFTESGWHLQKTGCSWGTLIRRFP